MSFLSDKLREVKYQPWYIYLTSLPRNVLILSATITVSTLALILIIVIATRSAHDYPQYEQIDFVFPSDCQTTQNVSCIFPFSYKGLEYSQCTTVDNHGVPWCSTGLDHRGHHIKGQWGNCQTSCPKGCSTVSGPQPDKLCMFPFKWKGTVYRECTSHMNSGKLWCPTQLDHLNGYIEGQWGNCHQDTCTGCRTVDGATCHLPFIYKNVTYDECTTEDSETLWCNTGGQDLVRADCRPGCAIGCHTYLGNKCIFPFKFKGKTFTKCEQDKNSQKALTWCATEVDSQGEMVQGKWEYCHSGCEEELVEEAERNNST